MNALTQRSIVASFVSVVLAGWMLILTTGCPTATGGGGGEGEGEGETAADAAAGQATFEANCMVCHGDPGMANGTVGPDIAGEEAEEIEGHLNSGTHTGGTFDFVADDYGNLEAFLAG